MALSNKLALVTGAASGIGASIVQKFAQNGASIILVDVSKKVNDECKKLRDSLDLNKETNSHIKISAHLCDVSNSLQVNALFKEIGERYPQHKVPNVLVNSAGIVRDSMFVKMGEKEFDEVVDINLKGTFLMCQAASRILIEKYSKVKLKMINYSKLFLIEKFIQNKKDQFQDPTKSYASFINLASVIGKYGNIGQANYGASKAGVEGLTRTLAKELGYYNIRCNSILPGYITTPMTEAVPEKYLQKLVKAIPLKRLGMPNDIAELALFLASDKSSYITGGSIECGGGLQF
jgi:17beta-estradiol 17-dehydrogenase / 3alpha(17beta)-hydroxysteroid dehydrogenase (NAD+) / 3-oxoacyl-[acyl-carrier protein] reductase alpha subunit